MMGFVGIVGASGSLFWNTEKFLDCPCQTITLAMSIDSRVGSLIWTLA